MKTVLSIIVSTATFFSARCESTKPERKSAPDPNLAELRSEAAPDFVEIPTPIASPTEPATLKWPLSSAHSFERMPSFDHVPLHAGSFSNASRQALILAL